jgi:hypothetical protein
MNHLDNLFSNPVQRIDAIMAEIFPDIKDDLRREKACKIEDIIRGFKFAQMYDPKIAEAIRPENIVSTFDALYDMDMDVLNCHMAALDLKNTHYMREQVDKNNRADWNKPDFDIWR